MKKLLFGCLLIAAFLVARPAPVLCVYCQGGTPCASNAECSLGCRCQAAPYSPGICVPQ